jgi:hypothetical protein
MPCCPLPAITRFGLTQDSYDCNMEFLYCFFFLLAAGFALLLTRYPRTWSVFSTPDAPSYASVTSHSSSSLSAVALAPCSNGYYHSELTLLFPCNLLFHATLSLPSALLSYTCCLYPIVLYRIPALHSTYKTVFLHIHQAAHSVRRCPQYQFIVFICIFTS